MCWPTYEGPIYLNRNYGIIVCYCQQDLSALLASFVFRPFFLNHLELVLNQRHIFCHHCPSFNGSSQKQLLHHHQWLPWRPVPCTSVVWLRFVNVLLMCICACRLMHLCPFGVLCMYGNMCGCSTESVGVDLVTCTLGVFMIGWDFFYSFFFCQSFITKL